MAAPTTPAGQAAERGRRVKRTALLLGAVAAAFYLGSMFILVWRGSR